MVLAEKGKEEEMHNLLSFSLVSCFVSQNRFRGPVVIKQQGYHGRPWCFHPQRGVHAFSHLPDLDLLNRAAHEEIVAGLLDGSLCILLNKQSPVTKHCMPGLQGSCFRDGAPFGGQLRPWYLSG